jgi:hypothetical protein
MPSDLVLNARKVGATENEILRLLERCGLRLERGEGMSISKIPDLKVQSTRDKIV